MTKVLNFFKGIPAFFLLSVLSGVLIGTSYIPFNGWALLFCFIPLWIATLQLLASGASLKRVFFAGWISQFILTLIGFNWIYYVSTEFGHLHPVIATMALLLFAALMHLYIPVSLIISVVLIRFFAISSRGAHYLILALSLALLERVWPSIFEWNLAYTFLWIKWPIYQWADTVGFWGLSTWLLLIQAALAYGLSLYRSQKSKSLVILSSTLILVAILNVAGHFKKNYWSKTDLSARIAVAQGNIGNAEKLQSEMRSQYHTHIRQIYTSLTETLLQQQPADAIIWPETALPFALDPHYHHRREQQELFNSINQWNIPVITGGYSVSSEKIDHLGYPLTRNAIFYLSPQAAFADHPYYKTNLLAFGEYMPFGEQFPILYKLLPFVGVYEKGSGPIVADVPIQNQTLKLGPQICYDSLVPAFTRRLAKNGAQIVFNVTNDSWFGWWAEPYQHGWMTLARAIEVRRPMVRSTNTGISTAILADGTLLAQSPINQTWAHTFDIPYKDNPPLSFYTRFGHLDWILWSLVLITTIALYQNKGRHVRS